jgi:hypothetical protein
MPEYVPLMQVAKRIGVDPTTVRRLIQRVGEDLAIQVEQRRGNTSNAKWTYCLTADDAGKLVAYYEAQRSRPANQNGDSEVGGEFQRFGSFYVIQLVPELFPNRVKIGYTDNLEQRLADHQCAAPTSRVAASWPCKRSWDFAAMDAITRDGCKWVLNEVFEGEVDGFVSRGNAFFALMPPPEFERPLSEHSPLHDGERDAEPANALDGSASRPMVPLV